MKDSIAIFWFRRDLRLHDNHGLYQALKGDHPVLPIFIFDTEILDRLPKNDARVGFIYKQLQSLRQQLEASGSGIALYHGNPAKVFEKLCANYDIKTVYTNHDYEPYALERDSLIGSFLNGHGILFHTFKDQVIFEKNEIVKTDGTPYVVYTPYMKLWKHRYRLQGALPEFDTAPLMDQLFRQSSFPNVSLEEMGFKTPDVTVPDFTVTAELIQQYENTRNFPALNGTSRLGPHLRFGTVSIRQMIRKATREQNEVFWQELIWREFFMQILWHFPHTLNNAFKPKYDRIEWRNNETEFELWKQGKTGFPLVDAGMRELNSTGYMHNRVRMLVASFLCKHLLIDWRWGESYFAEKLLDYEMASNVGNWQWAAGSGVDAAPYFRIFNPTTQIEKFDKAREYICQHVPEFGT
ncbi:MAG: deoxyribodipyrimidine photo-lyase, partial [Bacteroidota bacterium]